MRRRDFITLLGGAAVSPITAEAQGDMPVVGYLTGGFENAALPLVAALKQGLRETGFADGKNLQFEYRWANAQYDRLPELAADLIRQRVRVSDRTDH